MMWFEMKREEIGIWFPEKIEGKELQDFANWLNSWGDYHKHKNCSNENHITEFGRGYQHAVADVIERLSLDFKLFDKRTKTGFKLKS